MEASHLPRPFLAWVAGFGEIIVNAWYNLIGRHQAQSNSFSDTLKPLRSKVLTEVGFHIEITTLFDFTVVKSPERM